MNEQTQPVLPSSYGAIDLSQLASRSEKEASPSSKAESGLGAMPVTDADFNRFAQISKQVPVILVFLESNCPTSAQALEILEKIESKMERRLLLGKVYKEVAPQVFSAFQISETPVTFALINERPVPLYGGSPTEAEVSSVIAQIMQMCQQAGINGQLEAPPVEESTAPEELPEEYTPALEAETNGLWEEAVSAWKKIILKRPTDQIAKQKLAQAELTYRLTAGNQSQALETADSLFVSGEKEKCFDYLLKQLAEAEGEEATELRVRLLDYFKILGNDDALVKETRSKLATLLF
ncbi:tetratricopeptide repeat protein [Actinomycetaceae bacterium TAE3-ERU4]|nr:tetratricopeptide repeat protein [Actinomycetaceae bacterium TAE3-ERU4]